MAKTVSATWARANLGRVLDEVRRGEQYVIARAGKPVAALVPVAQYQEWQKGREGLSPLGRSRTRTWTRRRSRGTWRRR